MRVRVRTRPTQGELDFDDKPVRVRVRTRVDEPVRVRVRVRRKEEPADGIKYYYYSVDAKVKASHLGPSSFGLYVATSDWHFKVLYRKFHPSYVLVNVRQSETWYSYDEVKDRISYWEAHPEHREAHEKHMKSIGKTVWKDYSQFWK